MRVVITGAGAVVPEGVSDLAPLPLPGGGEAPGRGFAATGFDIRKHVRTVTSYLDRCTALGLAAARLAIDEAGTGEKRSRAGEWGLAYATAWGCLDSMELFFAKVAQNPKFAPPLIFTHSYANSPSSVICIELGLRGASATFAGGDAAALTALGWSRDHLVRTSGRDAEGLIVAASDALSRARRMHRASEGPCLGEAGAALVLEIEESARARGAAVSGAVLGWGAAFGDDAVRRASDAALQEAGLQRSELSGCWSSSSPEECAAEGGGCRSLWEAAGRCGPAGALLAVREALKSPAGRYMVVAADPGASAVAAVIERIG